MIDTLELPGARAVFSTRAGGVSEAAYRSLNLGILTDDDPRRVAENRARLAGAAQVDSERVVMGWQVHGTDLREWEGPDPERAYSEPGARQLPRVDGHLTAEAGLALLVLVADCYPVALSDGTRAAMLHCGWRPLAGGIVEQAVAAFEAPPAAAVGPGIGGCCYEVGPEVAERFADVPGALDGRMLDLRRVIEARLAAAGVREVRHLDRCTSCDAERYFSHRRDHGVTGRQAGLCVLNG
ncbi:MAG: purine-nucleoside/S-methyl-5-thioadenosine phosphorylase / adenosine deaminase [Thermoleophilaceae bacterium]|jgi:YfiH family protein|nr:purine-nucleoside/S-methyl-5-thioadenosine phosphorylase / adenosine deaminase [Thermoleophilaceae bacterium]